jgi:hypothetical protein
MIERALLAQIHVKHVISGDITLLWASISIIQTIMMKFRYSIFRTCHQQVLNIQFYANHVRFTIGL